MGRGGRVLLRRLCGSSADSCGMSCVWRTTQLPVLPSANAGATCSVEEQVACLIDQATDENLLGRAWVGWEPFL